MAAVAEVVAECPDETPRPLLVLWVMEDAFGTHCPPLPLEATPASTPYPDEAAVG